MKQLLTILLLLVTVIRILFLVGLLIVGGGLLAYLICALVMPEQK